MKIIGHRGAKGLAPENTLRSFEKALDHGVAEIECDVRVTRDGVPVLEHGTFVSDPSGHALVISKHDYAELRAHKPDLATLEQALNSIQRRVPLYIEVKRGEPTAAIVAIITDHLARGWHNSDFLLGSRDGKTLYALQRALPDIPKVVIDYWSGTRAAWRAHRVGTKRLSLLEYWLWTGFVRSMTRRGYELYSFPAGTAAKERAFGRFGRAGFSNDPRKIRHWQRAGLTGVITDYPDRFEK